MEERLGRVRRELGGARKSTFGLGEPALPDVETPEAEIGLRPIGLET